MIEKHYGKYIRGDIDEQFARLLGAKTVTLTKTQGRVTGTDRGKVQENSKEGVRWAHLDSNPGRQTKRRRGKSQ